MTRLLHAWEVAELLGRSPRWVLDEAAAGRLPSFKVGHAVRFSADEVDAWLEERRRGERLAASSLRVAGGNR